MSAIDGYAAIDEEQISFQRNTQSEKIATRKNITAAADGRLADDPRKIFSWTVRKAKAMQQTIYYQSSPLNLTANAKISPIMDYHLRNLIHSI